MLTSRFIPILLVLFAGAAIGQGGPPGGRATTVESTVIQPSSLSSTVHAVGTILADASAMLRTELPGQIVGLHFEDGQPIGKRTHKIQRPGMKLVRKRSVFMCFLPIYKCPSKGVMPQPRGPSAITIPDALCFMRTFANLCGSRVS